MFFFLLVYSVIFRELFSNPVQNNSFLELTAQFDSKTGAIFTSAVTFTPSGVSITVMELKFRTKITSFGVTLTPKINSKTEVD